MLISAGSSSSSSCLSSSSSPSSPLCSPNKRCPPPFRRRDLLLTPIPSSGHRRHHHRHPLEQRHGCGCPLVTAASSHSGGYLTKSASNYSSDPVLPRCRLPLALMNPRRVLVAGAAMSGPPRPPDRGDGDESPPPDLQMIFSRVQDGIRIFFAVLVWMALFFWSGAWNGQDKGRSNKSSKFRK